MPATLARPASKSVSASGAGDFHGPAHGAARLFRIPEIAFEIEDAGAGDQLVVERGGRQELACAEEGVHRALAIGRHKDKAARGRRVAGTGRGVEIDADGADVMAEDLAQLVGRDLANEGALRAQRGHAGQRIGRGTARNLGRAAHGVVEFLRPIGVDQGHPALGKAQLLDQIVCAGSHHIDNGIADGEDVVTGLGHGYSGKVW